MYTRKISLAELLTGQRNRSFYVDFWGKHLTEEGLLYGLVVGKNFDNLGIQRAIKMVFWRVLGSKCGSSCCRLTAPQCQSRGANSND